MIVTDTSGIPTPGKQDEALRIIKAIAAHFDKAWPLAAPRQVLVNLTGEVGRIHIIAVKESLAEHERHQAEQTSDATLRDLGQQLALVTVPGSVRNDLRQVA